ncbi:MAG TPA: LLM class flavin-dependent oxidoreductase [Ilumatobacteraceae bacterium]|nr:LLM class flavin-dependent oxidoreductase [Ilumatobacteraceae bacterium]
MPLSVLDLAIVGKGQTPAAALAASVQLAQAAERLGVERVWYAEHHNMSSIASSSPAVLIAHIAAHTNSIRLGAGGVMLPNHSPLVIAEQYGMLATLHPGRIELGLGRAPGSDQATMRAMRRDHTAADTFPQDVLEVIGYLGSTSRVPGVSAVPGAGTNVPVYILGSSLYGAQLAAHLGLPYAFASHFAPELLVQAMSVYRRDFRPSQFLDAPRAMAAVNVICAEDEVAAQRQFHTAARWRVQRFLNLPTDATDQDLDRAMASLQGQHVLRMMTYTAVGTPATVKRYLEQFTEEAGADELIVALSSPTAEERIRSLELLCR